MYLIISKKFVFDENSQVANPKNKVFQNLLEHLGAEIHNFMFHTVLATSHKVAIFFCEHKYKCASCLHLSHAHKSNPCHRAQWYVTQEREPM